jgi:transposase
MVVALGVDVHKKSHTIVAADAAGRQLAQLRVQASQEGDQQALRWACTEFAGEGVGVGCGGLPQLFDAAGA